MFIHAPFQVIGYSNIQRPIPLTCQNIYKIFIKHKPFSSQVEDKSPIEVEDKSGFPLKACGNDKPYIFMFLICVICEICGFKAFIVYFSSLNSIAPPYNALAPPVSWLWESMRKLADVTTRSPSSNPSKTG